MKEKDYYSYEVCCVGLVYPLYYSSGMELSIHISTVCNFNYCHFEYLHFMQLFTSTFTPIFESNIYIHV